MAENIRPIRVLQYGEGNFLRAFADWMIDILNEKTDFNGAVAMVKPVASDAAMEKFTSRGNHWTVMLRGLKDGAPSVETREITCVGKMLNSGRDYAEYADLAKCETLRYVISNTTEAGIALDEADSLELCPPKSFPGKVCKFLYERAEYFNYAADKGLVMLPCELIDNNGAELKKCVTALAQKWGLGEKFLDWLDRSCVFASTLVDRIVTGYPKDENPSDPLLTVAEPFALWVIESEPLFDTADLPILFVPDIRPYKQRKVRILNGAHTGFVPAAFLCGFDDVKHAVDDPLIGKFARELIYEEVMPTLDLPKDELSDFARAVFERFGNPFNRHMLLSICLNSLSKWRARCLPSLIEYQKRFGRLPERLAFSLAALIELYSNAMPNGDGTYKKTRNGEEYILRDEPTAFTGGMAEMADEVEGLGEYVADALDEIRAKGMRETMARRFG